jgi:hypothetical protein
MRDFQPDTPILLAHNGPLNGMTWCINKTISLGRDISCDIVINDRQVSRVHAQIKICKSNSPAIIDLNSKNGTYVNGEIISEPVQLKDGDEIKIALAQEFIFISSDATLPLASEGHSEATLTRMLFIDKKARRVWLGEKEVSPQLSVSQYELLLCLYENEGKVVSRQDLVEQVWKAENTVGVTEQAIDALVRRLRNRLQKHDPTHDYIVTVRGVGYILENLKY